MALRHNFVIWPKSAHVINLDLSISMTEQARENVNKLEEELTTQG